MARKGTSSAISEPTPERQARDAERSRLAALIDAEPAGEEPVVSDEPTTIDAEIVQEPMVAALGTPQTAAQDDDLPEDMASGAAEPTSTIKKSQVWEAIRAQKEALKDYERRHGDSLAAIERLTARLEAMTPVPGPAEAAAVDPEVAAWNEAVEETIAPHLAAMQEEQWKTTLALAQMRAAQTRPDYFELVNLDDDNNPVTRHIKQFPDVARQLRQAEDIGVALYDYAIDLRERDPAARERWVAEQREKIYAEERAKLLEEFKGVVAKGGRAPPGPTSIVSAPNGSQAAVNAPLTKAQIKAMDRRQLNALVARGEAGEDIH